MRTRIPTLATLLLATGLAAHAQASDLPREVRVNGIEFVHVPAGWFWHVASTGNRNHTSPGGRWFRDVRIWLDGFYIGKYEARARDLKIFLESGETNPADYRVGAREGCSLRRREDNGEWILVHPDKDLPATHLSWDLADQWARWLGFRLPHETEWVKAARGTDKRSFPWGNQYPDDTFSQFNRPIECEPNSVTAFPNGKSPYGAYNMAGNVLEWVADWDNEKRDAALRDDDRNPPLAENGAPEPGHPGPMKVLKGGRWNSQPSGIHVHYREVERPELGFRCQGTRFALDEEVVRQHLSKGSAKVIQP